jgi:hypothetical protein
MEYKDDLEAEAPGAVGTEIPDAAITEPQEGQVGRRTWLGTAVMLVAVFMELMDVTMANVAVPSIHKDLGASFAQAQWIVAGYSLAFAAALMTGGPDRGYLGPQASVHGRPGRVHRHLAAVRASA